jgi:hypothetical protein
MSGEMPRDEVEDASDFSPEADSVGPEKARAETGDCLDELSWP